MIECNTDGHEHISKSESDLTDKNTLKEDEHEIRTVVDVEQNENKNDQNDDNCLSAKKFLYHLILHVKMKNLSNFLYLLNTIIYVNRNFEEVFDKIFFTI